MDIRTHETFLTGDQKGVAEDDFIQGYIGTEGDLGVSQILTGFSAAKWSLYGLTNGSTSIVNYRELLPEIATKPEAADGKDTIFGGYGYDTLLGGTGDDFLYGGAESGYGNDDTLFGGWGDDVLIAGNGAQTTDGGNDTLKGGPGNDILFGMDGNDILEGDGDDPKHFAQGIDVAIYTKPRDAYIISARYDYELHRGVFYVTDRSTGDTDRVSGVEYLFFNTPSAPIKWQVAADRISAINPLQPDPNTLQLHYIYLDFFNPAKLLEEVTMLNPVTKGQYINYVASEKLAPLSQLAEDSQASLREEVVRKVQEIFDRSGISVVVMAGTPPSGEDGHVVQFSGQKAGNLLGLAYQGIDRFNLHPSNKVNVFVPGTGLDSNALAEVAAHEVGHALGVRHADASSDHNEVEDYDIGSAEYFTDVITPIVNFIPNRAGGFDVEDLKYTENPAYHIRHFFLGESDTDLRKQQIVPGDWERGDFKEFIYNINFTLNAQLSNLSLISPGNGSSFDGAGLVSILASSVSSGASIDFRVNEGDTFALAGQTAGGNVLNVSVVFNGGTTIVADGQTTISGQVIETRSDGTTAQIGSVAISLSSATLVASGISANFAPTAVADFVTETANTTIILQAKELLSNDSDPDLDALSLVSVANGVHGTVVLDQQTRSIVFSPEPGYVGAASFDYTISDGHGGAATTKVNITFLPLPTVKTVTVGALPATVDLATITTREDPRGQTFYFSQQGFGFSLAGGYDLTGDGTPDIVVGAYDPAHGGGLYKVGGKPYNPASFLKPGFAGPLDGYSVAVGNFNGGAFDIIAGDPGGAVSATSANGGILAGYLDQNTQSLTIKFDNYNLQGGSGTSSLPSADVGAMWSARVANVGDLNGDGLDEFFVAGLGADDPALGVGSDVGIAYILYGAANASYVGRRTSFDTLTGGPNGYFVKTPLIANGYSYEAATGGDFNGDGRGDLVLADVTTGELNIDFKAAHTAGSTFTFSPLADGSANARFFDGNIRDEFGTSLASLDLNADGRADLIIGSPGANHSNGAIYIVFGAPNYPSGSIDVNSPPPGVQVIKIEGNGYFGRSVAAAGDLNGDGFQDAIVGAPNEEYGSAYILLGGRGSQSEAYWETSNSRIVKITGAFGGTGWAVSKAGDINQDGLADVLISAFEFGTTDPGRVHVVYGSRAFGAPPNSSAGQLLGPAGDFNGDGRDDLLLRSDAGAMSTWLTGANGSLTPAWGTTVSLDWKIAGTGDFNGDGKSDVLWRSDAGGLANWQGAANGGFTPVWGTTLATEWRVVGTGDFNGDGKDDILWRSASGALADWLGSANGGFSPGWGTSVDLSWKVAGTGDFNGDGKDDILWRSSGGQLATWLGAANGGFTPTWGTTLATDWNVVGTGDFNGDGRSDLLWRSNAGAVAQWLGASNGGFTPTWGTNVSASLHAVSIGDFNNDGRDDVFWQSDSNQLSQWLGAATGGFASSTTFSSSVPTGWHVQPETLL